MPEPVSKSPYAFDRPGKYRIRVEGFLDKSWFERLDNVSISTAGQEDQRLVTVLTGLMRDQAELVGVVNTLYDLHLTLLSVEYIDEKR